MQTLSCVFYISMITAIVIVTVQIEVQLLYIITFEPTITRSKMNEVFTDSDFVTSRNFVN